nr:uncharacterized protein LOC111775061 isoform X2 [Equus caballus]
MTHLGFISGPSLCAHDPLCSPHENHSFLVLLGSPGYDLPHGHWDALVISGPLTRALSQPIHLLVLEEDSIKPRQLASNSRWQNDLRQTGSETLFPPYLQDTMRLNLPFGESSYNNFLTSCHQNVMSHTAMASLVPLSLCIMVILATGYGHPVAKSSRNVLTSLGFIWRGDAHLVLLQDVRWVCSFRKETEVINPVAFQSTCFSRAPIPSFLLLILSRSPPLCVAADRPGDPETRDARERVAPLRAPQPASHVDLWGSSPDEQSGNRLQYLKSLRKDTASHQQKWRDPSPATSMRETQGKGSDGNSRKHHSRAMTPQPAHPPPVSAASQGLL